MDSKQDICEEQKKSKSEDWNRKSSRCPKAAEGFEPYHKWIPVSKTMSASSEHVTVVMCGICFHEVNFSEAYVNRDCFKTL